MIDNVSIIIPTYNRPKKLIKSVRFLLDQAGDKKIDLNILIADSSAESVKEINRKNLMAINDNLEYLEFHPDITPFDKNTEVLDLVTTRYTIFCGDDDFLLVDAIIDLECFLDSNLDYSIASGRMLQFNINKDNLLNKIFGRRASFRSYPQAHISDNNFTERLKHHLLDYTSSWYSMHRTSSLKHNLGFIANHNIPYWEFREILLTCFDLIKGKRARISRMQLLRESGNTLRDENGSETMKGDCSRKNNPIEYYAARRSYVPNVCHIFRHYLISSDSSFDEKHLTECQSLVEDYLYGWVDKKSQSRKSLGFARKILISPKKIFSITKREISSINFKFELGFSMTNEYRLFKKIIN